MDKAIERFDRAVRAHAWRGGAHPADVQDIDREYARAKMNLLDQIQKKINQCIQK